jgi:hypothetical protein
MTDLPAPRREGTAPAGILALVLIVVLAVGGVFLLKQLNTIWRDDALFRLLSKGADASKRPVAMREYLLDPRNTRHRDEAEAILQACYTPKADEIAREAKDAELGKGMADLVRALGKARQPLVSLRVKEDKSEVAAVELNADRVAERAKQVQLRFTHTLTNFLGIYHVEVVEVETATPMVEINYRFVPDPLNKLNMFVEWDVAVRERPNAAPVRKKLPGTRSWNRGLFFPDPAGFHDSETRALMLALMGTDRPVAPVGGAPPGADF